MRRRMAGGSEAWVAVVGYVDQNNDVTQVCEGTNKKVTWPTILRDEGRRETSMGRPRHCGLRMRCLGRV